MTFFLDAGIMSNITNMENNTESFRTHKQKPACLFVSCNHYYIEIFSDKLGISRYLKFGFGFLEMPRRNVWVFLKKWHTIVHKSDFGYLIHH